jgi:condensin complex subunit 2
MSLLRDGDSINFQKASCTLDGCVKIYTSRVDSVASETGKLLSGLSDSRTVPQDGAVDSRIEARSRGRGGRRGGRG